jgi:hypothetical protein
MIMSGLYDYQVAQQLPTTPVDALLMAAIMRADSGNLAKLRAAFPELVDETSARYTAPGGRLPHEARPPVDCSNCGTSYDECTRYLRNDDRVCCTSCSTTATHQQNEWERANGPALTTEIGAPTA